MNMAPMKHSTPKISAYSVYTRNRKLADVPEKKVAQTKPAAEKKLSDVPEKKVLQTKPAIESKKANISTRASALRKRKPDIVENVNGTATEEHVVKKKRGRKKKIVAEEDDSSVVESSHSEGEQELEPEDLEDENNEAVDEESSCFKPSTSTDASFSGKQTVSCGNEAAEGFFRWLLHPIKPEVFFEKKWEKEPFLIQRSQADHYKGLYSTKEFERTVVENHLNYDQEIDVVAYIDGERRPIKDEKRVVPSFLWSVFKEGYSIRMRNPQAYSKNLGRLCSSLQEYFASYVGANMYLTPAGTQGFPPHYDDIDAFILQIEGTKHWKLYTPSENEMLARHSSPDLSEDAIGEPCMEVELNPGDLLYFPRGYIHQAKAAPDTHSLHITLSTNQLNTWGDFLGHAVTNALELAMENDIEFRKSIPKDYLDYMGRIHWDTASKERESFMKKADALIKKSLEYISVDYAADEHAIDFIHGSMPPYLNETEKKVSVFGNGARFVNGKVLVTAELNPKTKIRLIRRRAFRLVVDDDGVRLFHSLCNGKNHKEKDVLCVEIDTENVAAITTLFKTHPDYIQIKDLPHGKLELLLACLQQLYDNGFLVTENPLPFEE